MEKCTALHISVEKWKIETLCAEMHKGGYRIIVSFKFTFGQVRYIDNMSN